MRDNFASIMLEKFAVDWDLYYPRPYDLVFDPVTLAGVTTTPATGNKNVPQDWSYMMTGIYCDIWNAAYLASPSTQLLPDVYDATFQLFDKGASDYLMDSPVPIGRFRSFASDRYILPVPYALQKNTVVQQFLASADTRTFRVTTVLHGYKVAQRLNPIQNGKEDARRRFEQGGR